MPVSSLTIPAGSVVRTVLANGLTVLLKVDRTAPVAAIVTYVNAGYFDETDDIVGIAHVLEHMYFKGTPSRGVGEIAKQTKANGGYLNAATIYDHTRYYAVVPSSGFAAALEIQADAYANSVIDGAELGRELEVIIEEAKRKADNPGAVTTETLFELLHDRHRIRRWRIGREAGLRQMTRDQLMTFYRTWYRPSNTILSIVGDVDADEVLTQVESLYGQLTDGPLVRDRGPDETTLPGRRYRELSGDIAQTQVAFGWRTPAVDHPDTALLDLAAMLLGTGRSSRLYRAVRERRLASSVSAFNYTPTTLGVFVAHIEGDAPTASDAAQQTWRQVQLLGEGVSERELTRAQRLFESRWVRRLETMDGQANYLADWEALGGWERGAEYAERVLGARAADVAGVVQRRLDPSQASVLVYRPDVAPVFAASADDAFDLLDRATAVDLAPIADIVRPLRPRLPEPPKLEGVTAGVHVFRTRHGVPILVRQRAGTPIVHLGLLARGGTSREPLSLCGLGTLMTRTALKGTTTRTAEAIAFESEMLGGSIAGSVSSDGLGWSLSVPSHNFGPAVELLADVALEPTFSREAVETERGVALSQIAQLRDDMSRYPTRLATEAAYRAHPYARSSLGTDEGLQAIGPTDLRAWHASQILSGSTVLAVVGDVDPAAAAQQVAAAFDDLRFAEVPPLDPPIWVDRVTQRVEYRDKAQSAMAILFPGPARGDVDRHAAHLLSIIASGLGGRFFDELRDKQSLAYTVHATPVVRLAAGMFVAYIAMSPEKEDAARAGLLREFDRLASEDVTPDELQRACTYALGTRAIAQQSGGTVLSQMVDAWLYGAGLEELDEAEACLRAVTASSIRQMARRYFNRTRRVEGIVRGGTGAASRR